MLSVLLSRCINDANTSFFGRREFGMKLELSDMGTGTIIKAEIKMEENELRSAARDTQTDLCAQLSKHLHHNSCKRNTATLGTSKSTILGARNQCFGHSQQTSDTEINP